MKTVFSVVVKKVWFVQALAGRIIIVIENATAITIVLRTKIALVPMMAKASAFLLLGMLKRGKLVAPKVYVRKA